ncbi:glycosyltransferase [Clostridiaceae bacterium Marseille-Q4145]|nr:glycosyltransferase [Clostridiaceae bacterium Marseille-Q4145]
MEKVMVLLATYNGSKYLQQQLDSLYAQENIEVSILIRDDGSTDSTQEILNKNSKKHNLTWYQGEHKNVQEGYFELMKMASKTDAKYFAFCDQDDVWDVDKLSIAISKIKNAEDACKNNELILYYSGQRLVDSQLNFIEDHKLNRYRSLKSRFVLSDFAGCTGVFNKHLLNEVIKFKPDYMLMHDTWILRVCLCLGGNIIVDPEPRMSYRQHGNNTIGLKHGFFSTLKQVDLYINEYKIEKLTKELVRGYGNRIVPEYKELCTWICNYRSNRKYKQSLLDKKNIDYCNKGLNFTYWLKVEMHKL